MKKITLLVAGILLLGNTAKASVVIRNTDERKNNHSSFDEPISFVERGIEFFVFPNGDFDFNTRPQDSQGDYYYKTAGNKTTGVSKRRAQNYGVLIEHDSFGRVRRVGNTFINYDNRNRVNRIGRIYMRYNRWVLTQIGGMQLVYNRRGELLDRIGSVNDRNCGYISNYYHNDNYDEDYNNSDSNNSNDYYYYKVDGSKAKIEEDKNKNRG